MEYYLMQNMEPSLPFLDVLPAAPNDTGEFPTVLRQPTAAQDTADGVMGEPLDTEEASELTEVEITPLNAVLGNTNAAGYKFRYSEKFLNRSSAGARLTLALSKIGAGMAMKINRIILNGLVNGAGATPPQDLSDWRVAADPRSDSLKMRYAMRNPAGLNEQSPFQLNKVFLDGARYQTLEDYYMSMDWPFNSEEINVDGTKYFNVGDAFNELQGIEFLGMDTRLPPGIIEKYVSPEFSTLRKAELEGQQKNLNVPDSLININHFTEPEYPYNKGVDIWCELGYSNQEPLGAMAGALTR